MTFTGLIVRNALRNKRRCVLTLSSVALSLFLLTVLQVVLREEPDVLVLGQVEERRQAELAWVRSLTDDLRAGRLTWDPGVLRRAVGGPVGPPGGDPTSAPV